MRGEETINSEIKNEGEESTTLCELSEERDTYEKPEKSINRVFEVNTVHMTRKKECTDEKNREELINRLRNERPVGHAVRWTIAEKCMFPSDDSEKSLNHLGDGKNSAVLSYGGKGSHTEMDADSNEILSEKGEKSIVRCSTLKGNLQEMNFTSCIQGEYQSNEGISSEKSINHTNQVENYQGVKENPKTMIVTLCKPQCKSSEKSIIQLKRSDKKQMDQIVTPVHIPACTWYRTDPNNAVAERTDQINNVDLQHGWGKAVSFITNTSNRLSLSNALCSLAQIPVVAKRDGTKENDLGEQNDLDNDGFISNSSYTFFLESSARG